MDVKHFFHEVWRMRWMIVVSVAVICARAWGLLSDTSAVTLVLYKPALACIGFVTGHIAWSQCYWYVDGKTLIDEKRDLMALAVFVMRGMIYAAFILGVTLGL